MPKVFAILGDIHANIDALEAVLDDAAQFGVTDYACVGDVVGYNAAPSACVRMVRDVLKAPTVRGNHDHYVTDWNVNLNDFSENAAAAVKWTRENISQDEFDWLAALPFSRPLMGFTLVHSTLDMPDRWGYVFDDLQAGSNFVYQHTPICFHGHTHVPIIYELVGGETTHSAAVDCTVRLGQRLFVNVGSVGQPRDGDPRASYAIWTPATKQLRFRRVPYDIATAQQRIIDAGLPHYLAERLALGR